MKIKQYLSKITALCTSSALAFLCTAAYAEDEPILSKYKPFAEIFSETTGADISDIKYGIICYPSEGINRAAELEINDLTTLMNAYNSSEGVRLLAPLSDDFDAMTYMPETEYPYFYIGVSEDLPTERKIIKMAQLCFGGSYGGSVIYGGYGIAESSYGRDYSPALPVNFVWYKPTGAKSPTVTETANKIYNKYKNKAKPFGDYDGIKDDKYFIGYDGTFETLFQLPQCFTADGCSEWAYNSLHNAAKKGLIPYDTSRRYKEPLTRREFCSLAAHMLNMVPFREYDDFFTNPYSYTVLLEKANLLKADTENIKYADMNEIDESIKLLSAINIINGIDNNRFDPNGYITREQICTILERIFKLYPEFERLYSLGSTEAVRYNDDDMISDWAHSAVYMASSYGLVNGTENNTFLPKDYCTLEQALAIIYRASGVCNYKSIRQKF